MRNIGRLKIYLNAFIVICHLIYDYLKLVMRYFVIRIHMQSEKFRHLVPIISYFL